ncbi:MAG: twin-arginine translocase TatA/TatE family subunit [Geminicoccaceae bacterium]
MSFGLTEMVIILAIVLVLFGAGKLPTVMGDLAKGVRNFKAGLKDEQPEPTPPAPRLEARPASDDRPAG